MNNFHAVGRIAAEIKLQKNERGGHSLNALCREQ